MLGQIFLQFCSSRELNEFERRHYVRRMTALGRTKFSKFEGEPRGHHGQQIHYLIWYEREIGKWENVGIISGGSAVYTTLARDFFFKINKENRQKVINGIIDNTLFRLEFPKPNLASRILSLWRKQIQKDWEDLYDVKPYGFETFVEFAELPDGTHRAGALYLADNWTAVGITAGSTKNHVGRGLNGSLRGKPFNRENVVQKFIFCKWIKPFSAPQESIYRSSWRSSTDTEKKIASERARTRKLKELEAKAKAQILGINPQLELF